MKRSKTAIRNVNMFYSLDDMKALCRKYDFPVDRSKQRGYVYVVEYGKKIKIGLSTDIWTRLHTLESQARCYGEKQFGRIAFCNQIEHFRSLEKHLHLCFYNKRTTQYAELFRCRFEKAVEALETEQAEPYLIELPEYDHKRKTNANRNPRGSAVRLRNTLKALYKS